MVGGGVGFTGGTGVAEFVPATLELLTGSDPLDVLVAAGASLAEAFEVFGVFFALGVGLPSWFDPADPLKTMNETRPTITINANPPPMISP